MEQSEVGSSPFLTVVEAAEYARCHPRTIRRWMRAGDLTRYGHAGKALVQRAEIEALLAPKLRAEAAALVPSEVRG